MKFEFVRVTKYKQVIMNTFLNIDSLKSNKCKKSIVEKNPWVNNQ